MITRTFTFERETKNTYRFKEVNADERETVVGVLYVQKSKFDTQPQELTVTIEATK